MSAPQLAAPQSSSWALVRTLGIVSTVCGVIIVTAYQGTLPAVTENKRVALERAVFKLVPGATSVVEYHASAAGVAPAPGGAMPAGAVRFYAGYDAQGRLKGITAEGAARGYADQVRVLWAYDPEARSVVGFSVVQMRETPGIGDRILEDPAFLANFRTLDVRLGPAGRALANPVITVKHGTKSKPWEIDAISGATITSKAVGKGINDSAGVLLPRLVPSLEAIRKKP